MHGGAKIVTLNPYRRDFLTFHSSPRHNFVLHHILQKPMNVFEMEKGVYVIFFRIFHAGVWEKIEIELTLAVQLLSIRILCMLN